MMRTGAKQMAIKPWEEQVVRNLRAHFSERTSKFTDEELLAVYREFQLSEDFGNNDAKFGEWLDF